MVEMLEAGAWLVGFILIVFALAASPIIVLGMFDFPPQDPVARYYRERLERDRKRLERDLQKLG